MELALQITFRGMAPSPAIEAAIREKAAKLDRYYDHIVSCRVVVELLESHRRHGKPFTLHIDIRVPGNEFAITRDQDHEDFEVALGDAFDAARRRLEDYARAQRGDVKAHAPAPKKC